MLKKDENNNLFRHTFYLNFNTDINDYFYKCQYVYFNEILEPNWQTTYMYESCLLESSVSFNYQLIVYSINYDEVVNRSPYKFVAICPANTLYIYPCARGTLGFIQLFQLRLHVRCDSPSKDNTGRLSGYSLEFVYNLCVDDNYKSYFYA